MELSFNIPEWLKIPLKILLPASWLFSGTMIMLPGEWLQRLYLFEWVQKNGFSFGLIFSIASCLLLVYLISYIQKKFVSLYYKLTIKRKTFKKITSMSEMQQAIIYKLFNAPGYTTQLDYNQPLVQGLMGMNFIYMGGQQQVTTYGHSNCIPVIFTLQPFVYRTLSHYKPKLEKEIAKLERTLNSSNRSDKRKRIEDRLRNAREYLSLVYNQDVD